MKNKTKTFRAIMLKHWVVALVLPPFIVIALNHFVLEKRLKDWHAGVIGGSIGLIAYGCARLSQNRYLDKQYLIEGMRRKNKEDKR